MSIHIYRKPKKDNLYIKRIPPMGNEPIIKIIVLKKEILRRCNEDEDYWEFLVKKIKDKYTYELGTGTDFFKKDKFDFCKKVKIYHYESKKHVKERILSKNKCYIFSGKEYQPIDLVKLRENNKLYKKFVNRYCYEMNNGHADSETYADYTQASYWFQWFVMKYPEYHLPMEESDHTCLRIGYQMPFRSFLSEPKMEYDSYLDY